MTIDFENTALVVAHPDEEILFFSSILRKVKKIYFCFGPSQRKEFREANVGRKLLMENYPLTNICYYGLPSSAASQIKNEWIKKNFCGSWLGENAPLDVVTHYYKNFLTIYNLLDRELLNYSTIISHNPWGEYHHQEHVQVSKIVEDLCNKYNKEYWFNNYIGGDTKEIAVDIISNLSSDMIEFNIDQKFVSKYYDMYLKNKCWTFRDYEWPKSECFIKNSKDGKKIKYRFNVV